MERNYNTDTFKDHLQAMIYQELGVKVSKDKAWKLFKAIVHGLVEYTCNSGKLSLAGIGSFEILKSKARGKKAGLDKEGNPIPGAVVWPFVPRFRWHTSSVVNAEVEKFFAVGEHDDLELTHYGIFKEDAPAPVEAPAPEAEPTPAPAPAPSAPADDFFSL